MTAPNIIMKRRGNDTNLAKDWGTQAFRTGFKCEPLKDGKLVGKLAAQETVEQRLQLIDSWKAGWESAYRAEFV